MQKVAVFWFRRDLRFDDNTALAHAVASGFKVLPIFIFDEEILKSLPKNDARVNFIYDTLQGLNNQIKKEVESAIAMYYSTPKKVFEQLLKEYDIQEVFANHDYEPYALKRDTEIADLLSKKDIKFNTYKDQVIFEKDEVVKSDNTPYVVYTPFKNKWKSIFDAKKDLEEQQSQLKPDVFFKSSDLPMLTLKEIGFTSSEIKVEPYNAKRSLISNYEDTRNFPGVENGTSKLGPHLRFGTVSVRKMVKKAIAEKNETFWNELIWREFFMQILWHFPETIHNAFRPKYDRIVWRNNEDEFEKWKKGETGYALVDAGMRELNTTGYMHNRVRMLVASFLCKHLLIDWRWGEAYFAEKLLDYELSSNIGNWQWAAGTGVDAAPYFRIFNPITQIDKFDKDKKYINKWVPDLQELTYPNKMVDHKMARERCLKVYKEALN